MTPSSMMIGWREVKKIELRSLLIEEATIRSFSRSFWAWRFHFNFHSRSSRPCLWRSLFFCLWQTASIFSSKFTSSFRLSTLCSCAWVRPLTISAHRTIGYQCTRNVNNRQYLMMITQRDHPLIVAVAEPRGPINCWCCQYLYVRFDKYCQPQFFAARSQREKVLLPFCLSLRWWGEPMTIQYIGRLRGVSKSCSVSNWEQVCVRLKNTQSILIFSPNPDDKNGQSCTAPKSACGASSTRRHACPLCLEISSFTLDFDACPNVVILFLKDNLYLNMYLRSC